MTAALVVWLSLAWVASVGLAWIFGFGLGRARKLANVVVSIPLDRAVRCLECGAFSVGPESRQESPGDCKRCGGPNCWVRRPISVSIDVEVDQAIDTIRFLVDRIAELEFEATKRAIHTCQTAPVETSAAVPLSAIKADPRLAAIVSTAAEAKDTGRLPTTTTPPERISEAYRQGFGRDRGA